MGLKWFFYRKIQVLLLALVSRSVGADEACGCELSGCIVHQTLLIAFSDHLSMAHQAV
jgi:hypothetical protein